MTDHRDFLRRARMAQLLNKDDVPSRPERGSKDDGHRDEASRTEPSPDDALVSEDTLEVFKDAGHLAARLVRWTWEKTKHGCTFAVAKGRDIKAWWQRQEFGRRRHYPYAPDPSAVRRSAASDEVEPDFFPGADSREPSPFKLGTAKGRLDDMGSLPADLHPVIDLMIKPGQEVAPLQALDSPSIAAALSALPVEAHAGENDEPALSGPASVEWPDPAARALRFIHLMFVFLALLSAALLFAWWKKHGATEAAPAPAVAPAPSEIVPSPVEALPTPVAVPAVVDVPVEPAAAPTQVVERAPVQLPPPVRAPETRVAKPDVAPARPTVAKPKPVPAPTEEWQDKAVEDIDAWAQQMGIEPDAD